MNAITYGAAYRTTRDIGKRRNLDCDARYFSPSLRTLAAVGFHFLVFFTGVTIL